MALNLQLLREMNPELLKYLISLNPDMLLEDSGLLQDLGEGVSTGDMGLLGELLTGGGKTVGTDSIKAGGEDVYFPPPTFGGGSTVTTTEPPQQNFIGGFDGDVSLNTKGGGDILDLFSGFLGGGGASGDGGADSDFNGKPSGGPSGIDDDLPLPDKGGGGKGGVGGDFDDFPDPTPTGGGGSGAGGGTGGGTGGGGGVDTTDLNALFTAFGLPNFPLNISGANFSVENLQKLLLALAFQSGALETSQKFETLKRTLPALFKFIQGGGEGFSPEALAALRAEAVEGIGGRFNQTERALRASLAARGLRGGQAPVSGLAGREFSELGAQRAIASSAAQRDVTKANESQRLANLFNALNLASGFPSNPAASIQAGGNIAEQLQNQPPGFGAQLGSALLGGGLNLGFKLLGDLLSKKIGSTGSSGGGTPPIVSPSGGNPFLTPSFSPFGGGFFG